MGWGCLLVNEEWVTDTEVEMKRDVIKVYKMLQKTTKISMNIYGLLLI